MSVIQHIELILGVILCYSAHRADVRCYSVLSVHTELILGVIQYIELIVGVISVIHHIELILGVIQYIELILGVIQCYSSHRADIRFYSVLFST